MKTENKMKFNIIGKTVSIRYIKPPTEKELQKDVKEFEKGYGYLYRDNDGDLCLFPKKNKPQYKFIKKVISEN